MRRPCAFEGKPAKIKFESVQHEGFSKRILIVLAEGKGLAMETRLKPEYYPGRGMMGLERGKKEKKDGNRVLFHPLPGEEI